MKSIKLNFLYNAILNVTKVLFPLITAPYVARVLSPDGVGLFNFSNTYAGYFSMFALLGLPTYAMREVSKMRDDKQKMSLFVSQIFSTVFFLTVAVVCVYLSSLALVGQLHENQIIFLIAGIVLYVSPLKVDWFFTGNERFGFITLRHIIIKLLSISALFIFVKTRNDLIIYVLLNALCNALSDVWAFCAMLRSGIRLRFTTHGLMHHVKPALILFASAVTVSLYTVLDTLMLGFISDYSEVAYYNCASNISKIIVGLVTSFSAVAVPRLSYYLKNNEIEEINSLLNKSFSIVAFLAVPASFGLACIAPDFAPLFYGDQYYGSILPLQIMAFVILFIGLSNITAWQSLIGLGRDRTFLYVVMVGAVVNVSMNAFLIPAYGARGAALSSVVGEFVVLLISAYVIHKTSFLKIVRIDDLIKSFLGSLLFIPLTLLLRQFVDGWLLVGLFCTTGFVIFFVSQMMMHNTSSKILLDTARIVLSKYLP